MKQIQLTIKPLLPLAIGRKKPGGSVSEAETHIPGSVIRGGIAAQILRQAAVDTRTDLTNEEDDFQALFLDEQAAIFTNAYPSPEELPTAVLPATAVSSKTDPGFQEDKDRFGAFDTLIDQYCADACGLYYDPSAPDGSRLEPLDRFYAETPHGHQAYTADHRLLTRVGINRRRATAEEKILYSIEVLSECDGKTKAPQHFRSHIWVTSDDIAAELVEYLNNNSFRFGGSVSRGLGKVSLQANLSDPPTAAQLQTRVTAFTQLLHQRWQEWQEVFQLDHGSSIRDRTFFTLDLQSDAILDEHWRRTTVLTSEMLLQELEDLVADDSLNLEVAHTSYDYRSGWNSAWGLMKDMELVTNKGSVYLFSTEHPEQWGAAWVHLACHGIGARTAEGYGQVEICSPFHDVFREEPV